MEAALMGVEVGDTLVLDQGASGNLRSIEELLSLLWIQREEEKDRPPPVRACTGNLVVYLEREDDRHDILEIVGEVVRVQPCRVILMSAYPDEPERPIEVSVNALCWLEGASKEKICSEQIQVRAHGKKVLDLPGIVVPLLVSDMPVFLWWRDRFLARQELFEKFEDHIDHVIFEGLHWKNLVEKVEQVLAITRRLKGRVGVTNFNWSRLLPWQMRIAQFFEPGMYQKDLEHLSRVAIEYHTPEEQQEGRFFQALLLTGWLAGQLEWRLEGACRDGTELHYQFSKGGTRTIEVLVDHEVIPGGRTKGLQQVKFEFDHGGETSLLMINRDPENQMLYLSVKKEGGCSFPQKIRHVSAPFSTLLLRCIENHQSTSIVFDRAFANAVKLLKAVSP
jgi:glucose-6-phosphate dehydrogenase assembly protein OpcA